jgi:nucleoside-diphosphate-sugar epimerase
MTVNQKIVVGLLGSSGNLGSTFLYKFGKRKTIPEISVKSIGRPSKLSEDFNITKDGVIKSREGIFPDVIVNLSNSYFPQPNPQQKVEMEVAILGVAGAISNTVKESGCSVISASTYFQYCPHELQPWSHYSELKIRAKEIIQNVADSCGTSFTDFVLYDNFGGLNRNKFVDLLEQSILSGSRLDCTNGEQVLNLTHVDDLADALVSEVEEMIQFEDQRSHTYELKSNFTANLRELVRISERASGRRASINWGTIPYREREVFELWETGLNSPNNWSPKIDFATYIEEKFSTVKNAGA